MSNFSVHCTSYFCLKIRKIFLEKLKIVRHEINNVDEKQHLKGNERKFLLYENNYYRNTINIFMTPLKTKSPPCQKKHHQLYYFSGNKIF